ncbi:MAG: DUF6356 family protein [Hyphomicrobiales bacterium]
MAWKPLGLFTNHPATVDETYWEHFMFATTRGVRMVGAGSAAIIHAFFPFLFETTASRMMKDLSDELTNRRQVAEGAEQKAATQVPAQAGS